MQRHFRITKATTSKPKRLPACLRVTCLRTTYLRATCQPTRATTSRPERPSACQPERLPTCLRAICLPTRAPASRPSACLPTSQVTLSFSKPYRHSASHSHLASHRVIQQVIVIQQSYSASYSVIQHVTEIFSPFEFAEAYIRGAYWGYSGLFEYT
jgi:hypothetical protein